MLNIVLSLKVFLEDLSAPQSSVKVNRAFHESCEPAHIFIHSNSVFRLWQETYRCSFETWKHPWSIHQVCLLVLEGRKVWFRFWTGRKTLKTLWLPSIFRIWFHTCSLHIKLPPARCLSSSPQKACLRPNLFKTITLSYHKLESGVEHFSSYFSFSWLHGSRHSIMVWVVVEAGRIS